MEPTKRIVFSIELRLFKGVGGDVVVFGVDGAENVCPKSVCLCSTRNGVGHSAVVGEW